MAILQAVFAERDDLADFTMVGRYECWREAIVADGTAQPQATDFSGNGNHLVQATSGARPHYKLSLFGGKPAWRFDGVDDYLMSASVAAMNNTATRWYYLIFNLRSNPSSGGYSACMSGDNTGQSTGAGDLFYTYNNSGVVEERLRYIWDTPSTGYDDKNTAVGATVNRIMSMHLDGSNVVRKMGPAAYSNTVSQSASPPNGTFKMMLGAAIQGSPTLFGPVDIAALFMGNNVLTTLQKARLEAYLYTTFGGLLV